ncbi:MAG: DUF898 family protein [Burkholderiaceae bacterium]|jgi:uncharacterized membrane protein YjgN (DUF898 family)|nr:DUF898 family protein [Burkholderiaceae bacterium]
MPTHYQTLGLPEGAGIDEVRAACLKALQQHAKTPLSQEDFNALKAACAEIGNPQRKAHYDQQLAELAARTAATGRPGHTPAAPFHAGDVLFDPATGRPTDTRAAATSQPAATDRRRPSNTPAAASRPAATFQQPAAAFQPAAPKENADAADADAEHRFQFTGSGGEYFRIWITNLLLSLLTLGIYSAWAKVRREQYFHRNTLLDGSGFDYHGNPIAILKGRALAVLLLVIYTATEKYSWSVHMVVLLAALPLVPWLFQRSLIFRSRNSSWRGLRFDFHGSYRDACFTFLPYAVCVIFMLWSMHMVEASMEPVDKDAPQSLSFLQPATGLTQTGFQDDADAAAPTVVAQQESADDAQETTTATEAQQTQETGAPEEETTSEDENDDAAWGITAEDEEEVTDEASEDEDEDWDPPVRKTANLSDPDPVYVGVAGVSFILAMLCFPWFMHGINRYRLSHLAFSRARFSNRAKLGAFYRIFILAALQFLAIPFLFGIVVAILAPAAKAGAGAMLIVGILLMIVTFFFVLLAYLAMFAIKAYLHSRLNNEVWNNTRLLEKYRFASDQTFRGLLWIHASNFFLMLFTLGLYWPWAKVRLARFRAEHLALLAPPGALDNFVGQNPTDQRAIGEEIADAFDFDIAI